MNLPAPIGYLRLSQIIGNKKKHIPALIPIGKTTWWAGVKTGRFPKPIKLTPRTCLWRIADILTLLNQDTVVLSTTEESQLPNMGLWRMEDILAVLNQSVPGGFTPTTPGE